MKDIVISKLPKPGESVVPRIHPFPQNYTFIFTPGYHETTGAHTRENTHEPTGAHKHTCRPACENADMQRASTCKSAHTYAQACSFAQATRTQARLDGHACTHLRTDTHAHTQRHTCTLVRVGAPPHARSFAQARAHTCNGNVQACTRTQEFTLRSSLTCRGPSTRLRTGGCAHTYPLPSTLASVRA